MNQPLIIKTFFILIVQLMITYVVMTKTNISINGYLLYLSHLIIGLIVIFVPIPFYIKIILFIIFSCLSGIMYARLKLTPYQLSNVMIRTCIIFIGMLILSWMMIVSNIILGESYGVVVFMAIFSLFIFGLVTLFDKVIKYNKKAYAITVIILFSIFIIYDTHYLWIINKEDIISGAIDYYLDIVNISVQLSIFMYT